ncbi:MAG: ComF family protein [Clostridia bacterium]|nr:ComF family protein [Clostridia bacterium]
MKTDTKRKLLAVFFPERCPYCGDVIKPLDIACEDCKEEMTSDKIITQIAGIYEVLSPFPYDGKYKDAILKIKFGKRKQFAPQLADIMAESLKKYKDVSQFDVITFVPLHKDTLKNRGFNQSELLARYLSEKLNIPCETLLKKTKKNKPQHKLLARERKKNVEGVFGCTDKKLIKKRRILLVDDIVTTGLTLSECIKVLKSNGAEEIFCITFAKSQPK